MMINNLPFLYNATCGISCCEVLWFGKSCKEQIKIASIANSKILDYYKLNKYYFSDSLFSEEPNNHNRLWRVELGSESVLHKKTNFLEYLNAKFMLQEFITVQKKLENENYFFRFFTRHNKGSFMDNFINNMPAIRLLLTLIIKNDKTIKYETIHLGPSI